MIRILLSITMLGLLLGSTAQAQVGSKKGDSPKGDPAFERLLDALDYKYELTSGGSYKIVFNMGNGRTQLVLAKAATEQYGNIEVRSVATIGAKYEGKMPAEIMREVLQRNGKMKIGAWAIEQVDEKDWLLLYVIKVDANTDKDTLSAIMQYVSEVGDEWEVEYKTGDPY